MIALLLAILSTQATVSLSWQAPVDCPTCTYTVYRSSAPGACGTDAIAAWLTETAYDDVELIGQHLFYAVDATNAAGETGPCTPDLEIVVKRGEQFGG